MNLPPRGTYRNVTSVNLNKQTNKQNPHTITVLLSLLFSLGELTRGEEDGASPRPSTARCPYAPTGLSPPLKGLPGCLSGLGACS